MGQMTKVSADLAFDCVITNTLIVNAVLGIVKADIWIKGNLITWVRRETPIPWTGSR